MITLIRTLVYDVVGLVLLIIWLVRAQVSHWWKRLNLGRWTHFAVVILIVGYFIVEYVFHRLGLDVVSSGSLVFQIVFVTLLILSSWSHLRGWLEHTQQIFFIEAAADITHLLAPASFDSLHAEQVVDQLLAIFRENFVRKGAVNVNVFLFDDESGQLRFTRKYPADAPLDESITFAPGEGGAGTAYKDRAVVYIPWKRFGSAIVEKAVDNSPSKAAPKRKTPSGFSIIPKCFVPDRVQGFESVLSVPVLFSGQCYGVLNLDSAKWNVFSLGDFPQARFYGVVMGIYLHELERRGGRLS